MCCSCSFNFYEQLCVCKCVGVCASVHCQHVIETSYKTFIHLIDWMLCRTKFQVANKLSFCALTKLNKYKSELHWKGKEKLSTSDLELQQSYRKTKRKNCSIRWLFKVLKTHSRPQQKVQFFIEINEIYICLLYTRIVRLDLYNYNQSILWVQIASCTSPQTLLMYWSKNEGWQCLSFLL